MKIGDLIEKLSSVTKRSPWSDDPVAALLSESLRRKRNYSEELKSLLAKAIEQEDFDRISDLLRIVEFDGFNRIFMHELVKVVQLGHPSSQEDAIELLGTPEASGAENCLYEAAINVPDYDDFRSVARKSILALSAIKSEKSIEKIKMLADSCDEIIMGLARDVLGT